MAAFVKATFPGHSWEDDKFSHLRTGRLLFSQSFLERIVRSLFPHAKIETNVRSGLGLVGEKTGVHREVDVFLPEYKLGFEYQVFTLFPLKKKKKREKK